jgi:hypothetical protein
MKKILLSFSTLLVICTSSFAVSLTGTALLNNSGTSLSAPGLSVGQVGIYLNNDNNVNWSQFSGAQIGSGLSLFSSATFVPIGSPSSSFSFLGNRTAGGSSSPNIGTSGVTWNLGGGISTGDQFAILVFASSTSTTIAGDTYSIWRSSDWLQPGANGDTIGFAATPGVGQVQQINTGGPLVTGSVVPEPSTYALIALGGLVFFFIARRRKAQV